MPDRAAPDHDAVLAELHVARRLGLLRLREAELPLLTALAGSSDGVEALLRRAVAALDDGSLRRAAAYTLGLVPGTGDWPAVERRKHAAREYGVSTEWFRHQQERLVLSRLADRLLRPADRLPQPADGPAPAELDPQAGAQQVSAHYRLRVPGRSTAVTLHAHPVDLLRDVDVVVSPSNVYLALAEAYKSSVSATLRRAGALRGPTGDVVEDTVFDELRAWLDKHGAAGRPVPPGTVAATSAGVLERQGVRRVYHAALAVPRAGTNDYDVQPADVTRCTARALALLAEERERFRPPLRSVGFPLLGAGRGGLRPEVSLRALWPAVEAELARGADWDVHLLVHHPGEARLITRLLGGPAGLT